jgi:hypothetical protein
MQRHQLEHALRRAAEVTKESEFILVGSQAVHAHTDDAPVEVIISRECDIWAKARQEKLDGIEDELGKKSGFAITHGYFVDPVDPGLVLLPAGWEARLKKMEVPPVAAWCLDVDDLVVSKLNAGRLKDYEFVNAMLCRRLADLVVLEERIGTFPDPVLQARLLARLRMSLEGLPQAP